MINYKPLKHTLIEKGVKLSEMRKIISGTTLAKINKCESINTTTLEKICTYLNCRVQDVIKYERDE